MKTMSFVKPTGTQKQRWTCFTSVLSHIAGALWRPTWLGSRGLPSHQTIRAPAMRETVNNDNQVVPNGRTFNSANLQQFYLVFINFLWKKNFVCKVQSD